MTKLRCWWFGCKVHPQEWVMTDEPECMRCGGFVTYGDVVGDTRHNRLKGFLRFWLFRRWLPEQCNACGARYGHKKGCDGIPF